MTLHNIKQLKKDNGFTIIELLIVIIVIGILATLVLVGYNNIQGQANDTKRQADASSIRDAAAAFKVASTNGQYPGLSTFVSDVTTASNYQSGSAPINLDANIGANIVSGAAPATNGPSSSATAKYDIEYCGVNTAGAVQASATGMKVAYWSQANNAPAYVTTGTNTTGIAGASSAGCATW